MVALTEEMKAAFRTMKAFPVATASKEGWPNVVPIAFVELIDDETLRIADNIMKKTTCGPESETMQFTVRSKMAKAPAKSLFIMKIQEIYECTPGPQAGEKIA